MKWVPKAGDWAKKKVMRIKTVLCCIPNQALSSKNDGFSADC
jgi:hypothetical protein